MAADHVDADGWITAYMTPPLQPAQTVSQKEVVWHTNSTQDLTVQTSSDESKKQP